MRFDQRKERNTRRYQKARAAFLAADPFCAHCAKEGLTVAAAEIDHVVPVRQGGSFWDQDNWQGLCRPCHEEKTAGENATATTPAVQRWRRSFAEWDAPAPTPAMAMATAR